MQLIAVTPLSLQFFFSSFKDIIFNMIIKTSDYIWYIF